MIDVFITNGAARITRALYHMTVTWTSAQLAESWCMDSDVISYALPLLIYGFRLGVTSTPAVLCA